SPLSLHHALPICTSTISAVTSTANLSTGMLVNATGFVSPPTISSITATSIVVSAVATGTNLTTALTISQPFDAIQLGAASNVAIRDCVLSGRYGIEASNSAKLSILRNTVTAYLIRGIDIIGSNPSRLTGYDISQNDVSGGAAGSVHAISGSGGDQWTVTNNRISAARFNGIFIGGTAFTTSNVVIANNDIKNTIHEAINCNGIASKIVIANNVCAFDSSSIDGGITLDGENSPPLRTACAPNKVTPRPGKAGVIVNANTGTVTAVNITGNTILDPNAGNLDSNGGAVDVIDTGASRIQVH